MAVDRGGVGGGGLPKIVKPPTPWISPYQKFVPKVPVTPVAAPLKTGSGWSGMPTTPTAPTAAISGTKYIPTQDQMRSRSFNPQQPANTAWQAQPPTHPGDLGNQYLQGGRGLYIPNWVQVAPGKFVLYGSKNTQTGAVFNPPDVSLAGVGGGGGGGGGRGGYGGGYGYGGSGDSYFSMGLINWRI